MLPSKGDAERIAELEQVVADQAAVISAQAEQIRQLTALVEELRARLTRNSSNSSKPPSANPPGAPKACLPAISVRKPWPWPRCPAVVTGSSAAPR